MAIRISAYVTQDVYDLFTKVMAKVEKERDEPMSESQAVRIAIKTWARQEKVK